MVIGGTGGFGRRLVEGLVATTDLDVIIAARRLDRARDLAALHGDRARAIALDRTAVTADVLRASGASVVVDAAGPFQGTDYRVARAAIAAGMHYLDLADGRDFVAGFAALDAEARAAGVVALTGASSTPALSCAVLDRLTEGWRRIDRIDIAISPGNRASPRGLAVIRSILSYAGKPVRVFDGGKWVTRPGWGMLIRRELPGIGRRLLSLCETPDLDLVPSRFMPRSSALFRAGLELSILHLGLLIASLPVRAGLLPSLLPFARLFGWVGERFAGFGSDCGGMLVEAVGVDADWVATRASWSLVATCGDGPLVPTLPALAVLRAIGAGTVPAPGARACVGVVGLAAIEHEFARHRIETAVATSSIMSPFQSILGAGFAQLPEPVRRLHGLTQDASTAGRAAITAARNPFAWLLCRLAGLPRPGSDVPVTVSFHLDREGGEYWRRRFAGRRYASAMLAGEGADAGLLVERFWPFVYCHRLTASPEGVAWLLVKWRLLGIPLPRWTLPTVNCFETGDGERFVFDIDVVFPLIGPVIHYRGWLLAQAQG
jgi:uncharacterized protein DUF4166/saccharopine dehydrogenase-like protein